jgi:hypothetical protein
MGAWQGVAMVSLKFHLALPCLTLLRPVGGRPLKWPYGRFGGGLPAGQAACGHLLPYWTPHAVRLWEEIYTVGRFSTNHPNQSTANSIPSVGCFPLSEFFFIK